MPHEYNVTEDTPWIDEQSDGQTYRFYVLCPQDRLEIIDTLKRNRREALKANMKECELKPEQRYSELEAFEDRWDGANEYVNFINSPISTVEIARRALDEKHKPEAEKIVKGLRLIKGADLTFRVTLSGLTFKSPAASSAEGRPDPTSPVTPNMVYGSPESQESRGQPKTDAA